MVACLIPASNALRLIGPPAAKAVYQLTANNDGQLRTDRRRHSATPIPVFAEEFPTAAATALGTNHRNRPRYPAIEPMLIILERRRERPAKRISL
jgi:hypothetical protein